MLPWYRVRPGPFSLIVVLKLYSSPKSSCLPFLPYFILDSATKNSYNKFYFMKYAYRIKQIFNITIICILKY